MDDKLMNCSTELQWCADDFRDTNNCDDSDDSHYRSTISFSNASPGKRPLAYECAPEVCSAGGGGGPNTGAVPPVNGYINNQNFDINLAEVDIETFRSEDLIQRMIRSHTQLDASTDTLRIVESLRSLNDINSANGSPIHNPSSTGKIAANIANPSKILAGNQTNIPKYNTNSSKNTATTTTETGTGTLTANESTLDAISVDSLDLSLDGEINSRLIEKCSQHDKHRYRIALFDTSTHSALDGSVEFGEPYQNHSQNPANSRNGFPFPNGSLSTSKNPFEENQNVVNNGPAPTTPGSLVKMFMQNRASNENSYYSSSSTEAFNPQNSNLSLSRNQQSMDNGQSCAMPSVATVDSGDLPLHVLDISKKLKSMNLRNVNAITSSASMSSNTSFTSTTSSSTFDNHHHNNHHYNNSHHNAQKMVNMRRQYSCGSSTNPFVEMEESRASTRSTSTQFPEMFQEKGIQASPEDSPTKQSKESSQESSQQQTPVLVYYPNYSLPDLSFLDDILREKAPVYLSPVKHEPPKFSPDSVPQESGKNPHQTRQNTHVNGVQKRINRKSLVNVPVSAAEYSGLRNQSHSLGQQNTQRKCRPKSYTDYEMLLTQDFNPIQDWDSLNLLLPDDFKDFMEKNNLLPNVNERRPSGPVNYPIKHQTSSNFSQQTHPNHPQVRLRQNPNRANRASQRYSLQEVGANMHWSPVIFDEQHENDYVNNGQQQHFESVAGSSMVRSQTMPSCVPLPSMGVYCGMPYPHHYPHPLPHQHPHSHSHLNAHPHPYQYPVPGVPGMPGQLPNQLPTQWDMISSSSFQKLMSFLSKLDDSSAEHSSATLLPNQNSTTDSGPRAPESQSHSQTQSSNATNTKNSHPPTVSRNSVQSTNNRTTSQPTRNLSTQSSRASITSRANKNVNEPGQPPRIPPRNPNLRSSVSHGQPTGQTNMNVSNNNSSGSGVNRPTNRPNNGPSGGSHPKIVLKRPSTLKSGIPLPSNRPAGGQVNSIPGKVVTRTSIQSNGTLNNNTQSQAGANSSRHHHRRAYRPPF